MIECSCLVAELVVRLSPTMIVATIYLRHPHLVAQVVFLPCVAVPLHVCSTPHWVVPCEPHFKKKGGEPCYREWHDSRRSECSKNGALDLHIEGEPPHGESTDCKGLGCTSDLTTSTNRSTDPLHV